MENYITDEEFNSQMKQIKDGVISENFAASYKKFIALRESIHNENDYQLNSFWNDFSSFVADNLTSAIEYLNTECTASKFSWLSEVFEDIFDKSNSNEFIECLKKTAERFPEECKEFNIIQVINSLSDN